jgi:hypothetical protein
LAIIKLSKDLFENVSIVGRPHRTYVSSSSGVEGSITLSARPTQRLSEITHLDPTKSQYQHLHLSLALIEASSTNTAVRTETNSGLFTNINSVLYTNKTNQVFDGTSTGMSQYNNSDEPEFFRYINTSKQRRIADTKNLFISASFFDPTVYTGQTTNRSAIPAYTKINVAGNITRTSRDNQITNEDTFEFKLPDTFDQGFHTDIRMIKIDNVGSAGSDLFREQLSLNYVKDVLIPKYESIHDHCEYSFSNYQTLNFLTASFTNKRAVMAYPNSAPFPGNQQLSEVVNPLTASGGPYSIKDQMTLDFWINPRYDNVKPEWPFRHGTIIHHSSSYCVSLISGSQKDNKDLVDSYRILVQLGETATDKRPSRINISNLSTGEFVSKDGLIKKNHWHRITLFADKGKCTLMIDDNREDFIGPTNISSLFADDSVGHIGQSALFVGNYYDGKFDQVLNFFSANISDREGFFEADSVTSHRYENKIISTDADADVPIDTVNLDYPLCAEIHDIKLYKKKLSSFEYKQVKDQGVFFKAGNDKQLAFYLPVFFTPRVRIRSILTSPFSEIKEKTYTPTNTNFSLGVGGKMVNVENYVKDFAQGNLPRLFHLTESVTSYIGYGSDEDGLTGFERINTNKFAYDIKGNQSVELGNTISSKGRTMRNLLILPNDNGLANINYNCVERDLKGDNLVRTITPEDHKRFRSTRSDKPFNSLDFKVTSNDNVKNIITNRHGNISIDKVSMRGHLTRSVGIDSNGDQTITAEEILYTPGDRQEVFPLSYFLGNLDSRDVTLFAIPSMYYGEKIHPGSLRLSSDYVTGSEGMMKITVKDNGKGSLYRADCKTKHAENVSIGNIFYEEGLVLYKTPHPLYFGKGGFTFDFKGEHTTHTLQINAPCPKNLIFSSSNPTYQFLSASDLPQDEHQDFVYITDINIHDDNLNVIMKASMAQPVVKRRKDSFMFKLRQDF